MEDAAGAVKQPIAEGSVAHFDLSAASAKIMVVTDGSAGAVPGFARNGRASRLRWVCPQCGMPTVAARN